MSSDPAIAIGEKEERRPVEVTSWNELVQYVQFLCQAANDKFKICLIDEENEEICLQNKEEFDLNIKFAQDHGLKSLTLVIYIDDKHMFNGIYHIEKPAAKNEFPIDNLKKLQDKVLAEKWYIPVKTDEALGVCLAAAIKLAQEGKLEENVDCKHFIDTIVPEAFRKLQTAKSVFSWPREIQCGIFEMTELLTDLVGTRLRSSPVPVTLLNTLAISFDTTTSFSQKHKNESLPARRVYTLSDKGFLRENIEGETYGWLRSIIQRFIAQNGLQNIRLQFEYINFSNPATAAQEYNALLKLFSKCNLCINAHRFHLIFTRPIRQAIRYLQSQTSSNELKELFDTLMDICYKYDIKDEIIKLHSLPYYEKPDSLELTCKETCSEITPLMQSSTSLQRKSKSSDYYEALANDIRSMTMGNNDSERKNVKKQRTDEQVPTSLFTHSNVLDCIDELLTPSDKRPPKRKHHRDQQRSTGTSLTGGHISKKELKRSNTINIPSAKTYDRSNPEEILSFFAPMKLKVAALYDNLQIATSNGSLREVLKIEEKLKLLRPFSAQFIADENTPDGTPMKPGQIFRKGWILLNDGSLPWDNNDIQLINLHDGIEVLQQPVIPVTAPHSRAVITVDYKCANQPGTYESKWILSYRQHIFGPMIWCSIEVGQTTKIETKIQPKTDLLSFSEFEFIEVPMPDCFDLSKPYNSDMKSSIYSSIRSNSISTRRDSTELLSTHFNTFDLDDVHSLTTSDIDSLSNCNISSSPPLPATPITEERSAENSPNLIELPLPVENQPASSTHNEENASPRLNQPLDFVDSVVSNIFNVAKQASSTAKAIMHTLQALDEPDSPKATATAEERENPVLINTYSTNHNSSVKLPDSISTASSSDPMKLLIEMGFANRAKNQRLLRENANDLAKVIELLTIENNDSDWFLHRH